MSIIQDYKNMGDSIQMAIDTLRTVEETTKTLYSEKYGIDPNTGYEIGRIGKIHLTVLSEDGCMNLLFPKKSDDLKKPTLTVKPDFHKQMEEYNEDQKAKGEATIDNYAAYLRHVVMDIHDSYRDLMNMNESVRMMISQRAVVADGIIKAQHSDLYKEQKEKKLAQLAEEIEKEGNAYRKRQLNEIREFQHKMDGFDYIVDMADQHGGVDNIVESFFNRDKNRYIMKRATEKFKQLKLGSAATTLSRLANFEETFMDEQYAPLNNFAVFMAYRAVANARDDFDKAYARSFIVSLLQVFSHNFPNPDSEQLFINAIKNVEDRILANDDYMKLFKSDNISWSGHVDEQARPNTVAYFKNDIHPCGMKTEFHSGKIYSFVLPTVMDSKNFAVTVMRDFQIHYENISVEMFEAVSGTEENTILGYDRFMEYAQQVLSAKEGTIKCPDVIILSDVIHSDLSMEDLKFFLVRLSMFTAKTNCCVVNVIGAAIEGAEAPVWEFKQPALDSIDKVESNEWLYSNRLIPLYSTSYATMAINPVVDEYRLDFMILDSKEMTASELIYHGILGQDKIEFIPHSTKMTQDQQEEEKNKSEETEESTDETSETTEEVASEDEATETPVEDDSMVIDTVTAEN